MARVAVLGRSGVGKSWMAGKVMEDVLTDGDGSGRAAGCGCDDPECDHGPRDDGFVPRIETGEGAPDFDADEEFEYAVHIDIEDEEPGFSAIDDPVMLTVDADEDVVGSMVFYKAGEVPEYVPEGEIDSDGSARMWTLAWALYKYKYIRVVPDGLTDDEIVILTEMLSDAAMKTGDCHFSVDEAHMVAKKHAVGEKLKRLITGGRKKGVEWLFITQRPQNLSEDVLSQTDYTIYFNLQDRDRDKAAEKSEAIDNAEAEIDALEPREAIIEDFDQGQWNKFSTEELERKIPHYSGDDGKANPAYESLLGDVGEE